MAGIMRLASVLPLVRVASGAQPELMETLLVIAFLVLINLMVPWFGVDSRDGRDWQDR